MTSRPRLLFLSQTLPYPPDGGVNIRTFNILKILSTRFEIDLLCFFRRRVVVDMKQSLEGLRPYVRSVQVFSIEQEASRARLIQDHLTSVVQRRAYTYYAYKNRAFLDALKTCLKARPAIVHVDSLDLAAYLEWVGPIPTVITHHNVESQLLRRRALIEKRWHLGKYFELQSDLLEQLERRFVPLASLNVVCSPNDRQLLMSMTGSERVIVVPNGVDTEYFRASRDTEPNSCIGVGGTTWFPNKDALEFLCQSILPEVHRRAPDTSFSWVGRATQLEIENAAQCGLQLHGYVPDIRPFLDRASCFVAPLRVGGGTRLKLLDAWSMGKAIVSTTVGCEGLAAINGTNMLIRDDPASFADAVVEVLRDGDLRNKLQVAARRTAVEQYGWRSIGDKMLSAYEGLMNNEMGGRSASDRPWDKADG